ncbi:MAG: ATP-binding cassette domain-containing protein [Clostridia bacterium]|nr:ATP-binding cassette domain-containing protein [Clostridia bacterium]
MIKVENLCKTFERPKKKKGLMSYLKPEKEKFEAVKGVSFQVNRGEMVAFVGPNGAGKSTTIKMMTGIVHPTSGRVDIAGLDPTTQRKKLAYKIGCLFGQKSGLWMHLPAIDTYKLYGAIYDIDEEIVMKRINELVEMFDIQEIINVPVRKLSLGQRMICEIVGILIHEPEIIFLDEPTIGLDIVVKEKVRELIKEINRRRKTTVFLTSHDISDVEKMCDRVIIIDKGTIIIDESINKLKEKYMREKIITITYEENIEDRTFDYDVDSKEGNKVTIRVDESKNSVASVLNEFLKYGKVVDVESKSVSLEEVIYDIYTKQG